MNTPDNSGTPDAERQYQQWLADRRNVESTSVVDDVMQAINDAEANRSAPAVAPRVNWLAVVLQQALIVSAVMLFILKLSIHFVPFSTLN